MYKKYQPIWRIAQGHLRLAVRKNFVVHTIGAIKAMELLLTREKGDHSLLMPAVILHDVGWSAVPFDLQRSKNRTKQLQALRLHLVLARPIIREILGQLNYPSLKIKKIIKIVVAHKFKNPRDRNKRLLIDADNLSEVFKKQFYNDVAAYRTTPRRLYQFRQDNHFYTQTARLVFLQELARRKKEIMKLN
ncbi:MAG: HD domain-containing protein [Patescibacteria group bacterium]